MPLAHCMTSWFVSDEYVIDERHSTDRSLRLAGPTSSRGSSFCNEISISSFENIPCGSCYAVIPARDTVDGRVRLGEL